MVEADNERRMDTQACDVKIGVDDLQLGMACLVRYESRKERNCDALDIYFRKC